MRKPLKEWLFWLGIAGAVGAVAWAWYAPHSVEQFQWLVRTLFEPDPLDPYAVARLVQRQEDAKPAVDYLLRKSDAPQFTGDWQVQLARLCWQAGYGTVPARPNEIPEYDRELLRLSQRHPERPEILATLLRHATRFTYSLARERENPNPNRQAVSPLLHASNAPKRQYLAELVAWGREASRFDPDNSFFPQMEFVFLYMLGRDREAMEVLRRAAQKPRWDDYPYAEFEATRHFLQKSSVPRIAAVEFACLSVILFPHYAMMRSATRGMAQQPLPEATKRQLGWDTAQVASRMREQSRSLIGSLVGKALFESGVALLAQEKRVGDIEPIAQKLSQQLKPEQVRWLIAELAQIRQQKLLRQQHSWDDLWQKLEIQRRGAIAAHRYSTASLAAGVSLLLLAVVWTLTQRLHIPILIRMGVLLVLSMALMFGWISSFWNQALSHIPLLTAWNEPGDLSWWEGWLEEFGIDTSRTGSWHSLVVGILGIFWGLMALGALLAAVRDDRRLSERLDHTLRWVMWGVGLLLMLVFMLQWNRYLTLNERLLHQIDGMVVNERKALGL
ncbi:hypothetical protein GBSOP10_103412 [Armatimonadetes bacterium GBS]|jgi:hypothetical protein|nr:hypothetical protein GBSOP10_103412 [Armatimonadetes bacterium GBS]